MSPDLITVERFGMIYRKPFTTQDLVCGCGLKSSEALKALEEARLKGIVHLVQPSQDPAHSVWVPVPSRPVSRGYYDFTPKAAKLQFILDQMEAGDSYDIDALIIRSATPTRTLQRYLQMLAHLGCVSIGRTPGRRGKPRYLYRLTGAPLPQRIPAFFSIFAPKQREASHQRDQRLNPRNPREILN